MKHRVGVFLFALAAGGPASAIVQLCTLTGSVGFSPGHPGAVDEIAYQVSFHPLLFFSGSVVSRAELVATDRIAIDVIVTFKPSEFSGYRLVSRDYWLDDRYGRIGPLAPGSYAVETTVRSDDGGGSLQPLCGGRSTLVVAALAAPVMTAKVVEYYHVGLDHYFMTQAPAEIADLDRGVHPGWVRTGEGFDAYLSGSSDARGNPVCRWYGVLEGVKSTNFFSASHSECDAVFGSSVQGWTWRRETENAFEIALPDLPTSTCAAGSIPVYRLWNNRADSNHRFTTDPAIKQKMIARGYVAEGFGPEGVAMCSVAP